MPSDAIGISQQPKSVAIRVSDTQSSLRAELVKEANSLWNSHGWSLDPDHAWVTLAAPLPEAAETSWAAAGPGLSRDGAPVAGAATVNQPVTARPADGARWRS